MNYIGKLNGKKVYSCENLEKYFEIYDSEDDCFYVNQENNSLLYGMQKVGYVEKNHEVDLLDEPISYEAKYKRWKNAASGETTSITSIIEEIRAMGNII